MKKENTQNKCATFLIRSKINSTKLITINEVVPKVETLVVTNDSKKLKKDKQIPSTKKPNCDIGYDISPFYAEEEVKKEINVLLSEGRTQYKKYQSSNDIEDNIQVAILRAKLNDLYEKSISKKIAVPSYWKLFS